MTNETTPAIGLPLLHAAQAQKEWTHNEALLMLDALAGGAALHGPAGAPPLDARPGSLWRVGASATGEWAGQEDRLAIASPAGWRFVAVAEGAVFPRASDGAPVRRTAAGWDEGGLALDRLTLGRLTLGGRAIGGATAVPDPTGGTTVDEEARRALTKLLATLRDQGLVV